MPSAKDLLAQAVTEDDGGHHFVCPVSDGTCGANGDPFKSTGWPTRDIALDRGGEHFRDHGGVAMSSLEDFRAKHGLTPADDGLRAVVTAKDVTE